MAILRGLRAVFLLIRNEQVAGSSPVTSSIKNPCKLRICVASGICLFLGITAKMLFLGQKFIYMGVKMGVKWVSKIEKIPALQSKQSGVKYYLLVFFSVSIIFSSIFCTPCGSIPIYPAFSHMLISSEAQNAIITAFRMYCDPRSTSA